MGACCSKTNSTITSPPTPPELNIKPNPEHPKNNTATAIVASPIQQEALKKDVFVVKHRKSHEIDTLHLDQETRKSLDLKKTHNSDISQSATTNSVVPTNESGKAVAATVRTSRCTKEKVDVILIQCGRLSRNSSYIKPAGGETLAPGRRYSGLKRSFDFDTKISSKNDDDEVVPVVDDDQHWQRQQRELRVSFPSRRGSGKGGRRVSRTPIRRFESPNPNSNGTVTTGGGSNRPRKMVFVPAINKSNNPGTKEVAGVCGGVKRNQVKQNAGEAVAAACSRTATTARSKSSAMKNIRVLNKNQNQPPMTLSQSNSSKAEHSPYQRTPLGKIDTNIVEPNQPRIKMLMNKYVTVRRSGDADAKEQESSGSNSFVSGQQWSLMSSSWEMNSCDSTADCWTSNPRLEGDVGFE